MKRVEFSTLQLQSLLVGVRVKLDCGHRFCFHNLSNTLVVHPDGKMECSDCYQSERVSQGIDWIKFNEMVRGYRDVPEYQESKEVKSCEMDIEISKAQMSAYSNGLINENRL